MIMGSSRTRSIPGRPLILGFLVLTVYFMQFSHATDTLAYGESMADGQTLVSAGQRFVLGFFSPVNSSNRYVGIWYYKDPAQLVVWVANRQNPTPDKTGNLTINSNGNLMILDRRGRSYVFTMGSASAAAATRSNTSAELLDTGNLILRERNPVTSEGRILWESFDYPTHTLLPHMKFGLNKITGENQFLTSWRSAEDPAPGDFALSMDPNGTSQVLIWRGVNTYWTSGEWNGQIFSRVPEIRISLQNFSYVSDHDGNYFSYGNGSDPQISRFVMDISGQFKLLVWAESPQTWLLYWSRPRPGCDVYRLCGAFSSCNEIASPLCECLPGFEPAAKRDWSKGVWSGGCQRKTALQCNNSLAKEERDGFLVLNKVRLPEIPQSLRVGSHEGCNIACLNSCSCSGYAYDRGCYVWEGDFFNLQKLRDDDDAGRELYLRLAASVLESFSVNRAVEKRKGRLWIIIVVVIAILLVVLGIFLYYLKWKKTNGKELRILNLKQSMIMLGSTQSLSFVNRLDKCWNKDSELQLFSFVHIAAATDNFSSTNKLGQGGFGPVYKGKLLEEQEIAVKRLSRCSGQGLEEFINEVTLIAKVQHMNLVRLLGCCIEGEEKMLIYEYMPNKSLDFFLFDPNKQKQLDWTKRVRIIDGIAQGLLYLHTYSRLRIIHRDLKSSNILLDSEMNPKISDFGMARIVGRNEAAANTNRVVGTYGYMSPEYAMEGLFSEKSDVYSFGVMLLEIISGKKNSTFYCCDRPLNLLGHAWELWKEGTSIELKDLSLADSSITPEYTKYVHVALLCVQESAPDRPTMSDVIYMIKNQATVLPVAKQPAFFIRRTSLEAHNKMDRNEICSINDVTVSELEAR